jgi:hypothetical protein
MKILRAPTQPHRVLAKPQAVDGTYPIAGEPQPPEEEPKPRLPRESQHKRLQEERFEGDARGGWQTSPEQIAVVRWQLLQGHAEPVVYRGDGGAVGKGLGYSCAIRKGSKTRAAEQPPRYGPTRRVPDFYNPRDDAANAFLKDKPKVGAPLVGETPDNSADSKNRVTPMRRKERSTDTGFDDDGERGNDEGMSDQSVAEVAAWRSGSESGLKRHDPARRLLFEREIAPPGQQAELRRAGRWIEAELAAYPWTFARSESGGTTKAQTDLWTYDLTKIESILKDLADDLPDPWQLVRQIAEGLSERDVAKSEGLTRHRIRELRGELAFAGWAGGLPEISTSEP